MRWRRYTDRLLPVAAASHAAVLPSLQPQRLTLPGQHGRHEMAQRHEGSRQDGALPDVAAATPRLRITRQVQAAICPLQARLLVARQFGGRPSETHIPA